MKTRVQLWFVCRWHSRRSVASSARIQSRIVHCCRCELGWVGRRERENILRNSNISISSLTLRTSSHGRAASSRFCLSLHSHREKTNGGGWQETPSECEGRKRDEHADNVEEKRKLTSYRERRNERTNANDERCRHEGEEWEGCEYPFFPHLTPTTSGKCFTQAGNDGARTHKRVIWCRWQWKKKESKPFDSRRRAKAFWGCVKSEENFWCDIKNGSLQREDLRREEKSVLKWSEKEKQQRDPAEPAFHPRTVQ